MLIKLSNKSIKSAAIAAITATLIIGCNGGSSNSSSPTPPASPHFVYVANTSSAESAIDIYSISLSTGMLTMVGSESVAGNIYKLSGGIAINSSGSNLYATALNNSLLMYSIESTTGLLTPLSTFTVPANYAPQAIALDPTNNFAYSANAAGTISMYNIIEGILNPLTPPDLQAFAGNNSGVVVTPSGQFVYETAAGSGTLLLYSRISESGMLAPLSPASISISGAIGITVKSVYKFPTVPV